MNFRIVIYLISYLILLEGFAMAFSAGVSVLMKDPLPDALHLLLCSAVTIIAGLAGAVFTHSREPMKAESREGCAVVTFGWLLISLFGALPFMYVTGLKWYDAIFETISGFTTTGATLIDRNLILANGKKLPNGLESLTYGIHFWRSLTQWIGGMGIVVFSMAILPTLGGGAQALYNAEVPGVKIRSDQFTPRIAGTAKILCMVYFCMTALESIMLYLGGMEFFDAVCHSFTTIATGGFSTKNNSIAFYQSPYIQLVITLFMFLGACNFLLHFRLLTGLPLKDYLNEEFRTYFALIAGSIFVIGLCLFFSRIIDPVSGNSFFHSPGNSFRAAAFQVISISSTTGFTTADFALWPPLTGVLLIGLMFMGGCGGSTSGGIKCVRIILLAKFSMNTLRKKLFPRSLQNIRLNGERLDINVLGHLLGFFTLYMAVVFIFMILLTACCQIDILSALSASITCISNVGPAFGQLSPSFTCSWLNPPAKLLMALEMLIGRLELYSVIIFFLPSFWKK